MGTNGEHLCSGEQIFGKHDARISSLAMVYIHMSFAKQPPRRVGRGAAVKFWQENTLPENNVYI